MSYSQMVGVICEGQYFQSVMRVGFQIRSTLVSYEFWRDLFDLCLVLV
jgi:hypothetical protein